MKKKFLSILAAFAVLVSLSACQAGDTGQEVELIDEQNTSAIIANLEETPNSTLDCAELENNVNETIVYLKETQQIKDNAYHTFGIIDYNIDGCYELLVVSSTGDQGYNNCKLYSLEKQTIVAEFKGFERDGTTYFSYDKNAKSLIIWSEYQHSYCIKNQKVESISSEGTLFELFNSTYTAESIYDNFTNKDAYIDGKLVNHDIYEEAYNEFCNQVFFDIPYIYNNQLFCGNQAIESRNQNLYELYLNTVNDMEDK